jgi:hypothetical protein
MPILDALCPVAGQRVHYFPQEDRKDRISCRMVSLSHLSRQSIRNAGCPVTR